MNLPEHLKKKMEESWMHVSMKSSQISANSYLVDKQIHDMSYESACAELLPMIEKLERALERQPRYTENNENELVELHSFAIAREALDELKKWRES